MNPRLGGQRRTKWFFERARGQYNEARSRSVTAAERREFDQLYPNHARGDNIKQVIKKEELAK